MVPLSRPGDHFQSEKGVTFVREEGGHFSSEFPRYKKELDKLHDKQDVLRMSSDLNIREKLDYSMNIIGNLTEFFRSGDPEVKIKLLGSIFPEKIYFDGKNYRTSRFNHMFSVIFHETKHLQNNKKMESPDFSEDSTSVAPRGIEPLFKV